MLFYSLLILFTGFSLAIRQDFQRTQPTITARLAITTSRYTTQPRGTCSANCSIQIPLIYHDARVPRTTAGNATTSTSLESNSRIEDAYLLAIQSDANLWEYAYNKKVVLMSPTNLISALRLSLDLWKRENQVKNVQAIIKRGTALYEKIVGFTDTFLTLGDRMTTLQKDYDKALNQLSEGNGSVVRQAEMLKDMSLTPKKRISARLLPKEEIQEDAEQEDNK